MDNAARNYNSNATSDNNSCRYSGCSGNQCKNDFTTAQAASCSSNAECTPNAVCDGNMVVDVNQPIACGEEGTIDVTVTNVNGANVSIVCDGVASFGTQSADMDHDMEMMECTDAMQSIYDTVTANLNKEAL